MKELAIVFFFVIMVSSTCDKNSEDYSGNLKATYTIGINQEFAIEMISNPTTGYSWKWMNSKNVTIVDSVGENYMPDKPALMGSGGKETWKFRGVRSGTDTLVFEYCRPWDPKSTADTNIVVVKVL